jgi:DNA invertase Pin-like site-specific DNA recombinase
MRNNPPSCFRTLIVEMLERPGHLGQPAFRNNAALAEFERSMILARTSDGRARAKAKGVRFGRKASLTSHQREEALARLANGEAQADVARSYDVSQSTISRLAP